MPVRQEDDGLDCAELKYWLVRPQQVFCGEVEEEEGVECNGDTDVVDNHGVDIAVGWGPVAVMVEARDLEHDHNECHDALDDAELECSLFAEPQEANVVRLAPAQRPRGPVAFDGLPPDLGHDVALAPEILVAETQEVVDNKRLVTVADSVEIDIEVVVTEEQEANPGLECVDGDDEEDPDDPPLLSGVGVEPEILVDLVTGDEDRGPGARPRNPLPRGGLEEGGVLERVVLRHIDHDETLAPTSN